MGWRKELKKHIEQEKEFRRELRAALESTDKTLKSLLARIHRSELGAGARDLFIAKLTEQNEKLMDRILARSLPELKTYTLPEGVGVEENYNPEMDEDLAGEVLDTNVFENRTS